MTIYVMVAFRCDEEHSVMYETLDNPSKVANTVLIALTRHNADVISIRKILKKQVVQQPSIQDKKWTDADKRTTT
jgi:hypothetical protein